MVGVGRVRPGGQRRGFDSPVQVASGIAAIEGSPAAPGALPAQALDHGTLVPDRGGGAALAHRAGDAGRFACCGSRWRRRPGG
ncbi:hypothetical protein [Streptomyces sp. KL116D]|uniref:hypothetical protein n=1 Tax=Streptomyces sp. KL116D TaxID=3045152 RepID=UPI0035585412